MFQFSIWTAGDPLKWVICGVLIAGSMGLNGLPDGITPGSKEQGLWDNIGLDVDKMEFKSQNCYDFFNPRKVLH